MNNKKLLSAAILLVLAKSAVGIEVVEFESNNTSTSATELKLGGIENVGQLSDGNDVDFFTISTSTKDEQGIIQYNDISLSFACNSRALATKNKSYGWYLTIHDDNGQLQSSYQVDPEECATGTASSKGPYNFKLPKPTSDKPAAKYYLSVVGDCRKPSFNISSNSSTVTSKNISINTTDKPATASNITKATKSLSDVKNILDDSKAKLIGFNKDLAFITITDAIDVAQKNILSNGSSELKNIQLSAAKATDDIDIDDYISTVTDITTAPSTSKAQIDTVKSTLTTVKSLLTTVNTSISSMSPTIIAAKDDVITTATKISATSTKADIDDLVAKINNFNVEIDRLNFSISNLNSTVANLNTAVDTAQDICSSGNTANYTIKDNSDTAIAPYKTIKEKSIVLGKENSGQNGSVTNVDFFELTGAETDVISLKFSCAKNSAKGKDQGWVLSAWKPNDNDVLFEPEFVYQVAPVDCNAPEVYSIQLPAFAKNYYIGVQSACALPPRDTSTTLQSSYFYSNSTSLDYLCDANTANFTIKRDFKTATLLGLYDDATKTGEKMGRMNSKSDYDLFVVENNATEDYSINFSCEDKAQDDSQWKISVYDDSDKLASFYPKFIKGSECKKTDKVPGFKLGNLPKSATRYYITVEPPSTTETPDSSDYTIKKSLNPKPVEIPPSGTELAVTLGQTKLFSTIEKGHITSSQNTDDKGVTTTSFSTFNYYVDGSSKKETELVFSCNAPKILFSNNWKVSILKSDKTLKDTYIINSSDCIPDKVTGESSYTITIPKESARFYMQVKAMCEDSNCTLDDSEFEIKRKAETVATSTENTPTPVPFTPYSNIDTKKISTLDKLFKKRIKKADEIHFYNVESSLEKEIFVQFACEKNVNTTGWTIGIWEYDLEAPQNAGWLYEKQIVLPTSCVNDKVKIAIPSNSSTHLISVQSSCLTAPVGNDSVLSEAKSCNVNTGNYSLTSTTDTPTTPTKTTGSFDSVWLTAKINLGATLQTGQISDAADTKIYQVDTGTEEANLTFTCLNSVRYQNDWKLLIYDSAKNLKSTTLINGSSCATATGYAIPALAKESATYYLVVKSACEVDDKSCVVDKSSFQLKRITATQAVTNAGTKPCFGNNCAAVTTPVKPFFR